MKTVFEQLDTFVKGTEYEIPLFFDYDGGIVEILFKDGIIDARYDTKQGVEEKQLNLDELVQLSQELQLIPQLGAFAYKEKLYTPSRDVGEFIVRAYTSSPSYQAVKAITDILIKNEDFEYVTQDGTEHKATYESTDKKDCITDITQLECSLFGMFKELPLYLYRVDNSEEIINAREIIRQTMYNKLTLK
jgi:hypothetical protein